MKATIQRSLFTIVIACAMGALMVTSSFADTPSSSDEDNSGQTMQPGMYPGMMGPGMGPGYMGNGGMMGPGYMQKGMGPGQMGNGGMMGPGYMHEGMGPGYMRHQGMGYGGMGMMQSLDLDKSQRSKLRALMRKQRTANCKTMNEMMDIRDELADAYDNPQPDPKAIGKLYSKMSEIRRNMIEESVQMQNKVRALLNKQQKERFDYMRQSGMGMMGNGGMMNMME